MPYSYTLKYSTLSRIRFTNFQVIVFKQKLAPRFYNFNYSQFSSIITCSLIFIFCNLVKRDHGSARNRGKAPHDVVWQSGEMSHLPGPHQESSRDPVWACRLLRTLESLGQAARRRRTSESRLSSLQSTIQDVLAYKRPPVHPVQKGLRSQGEAQKPSPCSYSPTGKEKEHSWRCKGRGNGC